MDFVCFQFTIHYTSVCLHACVYVCMYVCMFTNMCVHSFLLVGMYVHQVMTTVLYSFVSKCMYMFSLSVSLYSESLLCVHQTFVTALAQACNRPSPMIGEAVQLVLPQFYLYSDFVTQEQRYSGQVSPLSALYRVFCMYYIPAL